MCKNVSLFKNASCLFKKDKEKKKNKVLKCWRNVHITLYEIWQAQNQASALGLMVQTIGVGDRGRSPSR